MMRKGLLWLSEQQRVFRFVRSNPLARKFAARFVAGETVDTAIAAARELNSRRITATLDLLGESVGTLDEARAASQGYLRIIETIVASGVERNLSLKLTQLGLDLDKSSILFRANRVIE